jgi:hypothetical protein
MFFTATKRLALVGIAAIFTILIIQPSVFALDARAVSRGDSILAGGSSHISRLPAPGDLSAIRYGDSYMVTWTAPQVPGIAGYNVYRSFLPWPCLAWLGKLNSAPVADSSYLDDSVANLRFRQYYWVAAVDNRGCLGRLAGPACIEPWVPDTSPPLPPRNVQAGALEIGASITWDHGNVEPDFAGFNVYAFANGNAAPAKLNQLPLEEGFFYWEEGLPGQVFSVHSVDTSGNESEGVLAIAAPLPEDVIDFVDPSGNMDPRVSYAGYWKDEYLPGSYGGRLTVCAEAGASVEVAFEGRSATLLSSRYWQCGWCEVFLDGTSMRTVNLHAEDLEFGFPVFAVYDLRPGSHTIKLVNTGAPGTEEMPIDIINVDYIIVR